MPMQFLIAEQTPTQYHYQIWLDTTKTLQDGKTPDPAYIRDYVWVLTPPEGVSREAYQQQTIDEVKLLAQADLDTINATLNPHTPTPLSVHGATF